MTRFPPCEIVPLQFRRKRERERERSEQVAGGCFESESRMRWSFYLFLPKLEISGSRVVNNGARNINRHLISVLGESSTTAAFALLLAAHGISCRSHLTQRNGAPIRQAAASIYGASARCYRFLETNSCRDALGYKSLSHGYRGRNVTCRFVVESVHSSGGSVLPWDLFPSIHGR